MARYRIIDTAAWPRRDHFTFYRQFANPSFNLCVPIERSACTNVRRIGGSHFFSSRSMPCCARPTGAAAPAARARWRGD